MTTAFFRQRPLSLRIDRRLLAIGLLALVSVRARAQFTANNQTNLIDGATVPYATTYYVGNGYWGDALIITNGGLLTAAAGQLGTSANGSNNLAVIAGADSVWSNTGTFYVGDWGSDNLLRISGGGKVFNSSGYINYRGSRGNAVEVSGAGSVWSNTAAFSMGSAGVSNALIVTDGGKVYGHDYSYLCVSSLNRVRIAGSGSAMTITPSGSNRRLYVAAGTGNEVSLEDGGSVDSGSCSVFYSANSTNNMLRIEGTGSVWECASTLTVADKGYGNRMIVTNGGIARNGNGTLGGAGAIGNAVMVCGSGSAWTNSGVLTVGGSSSIGNTLMIADGGAVFGRDYSYLGSGQTGGSSGNEVLIDGIGSRLYITPAGVNRRLFIGWSGADTRVTIRNGGLLDCGEGTIAYNSGGQRGIVSVEGPGSLWRNTAALIVGRGGASNRLVVTDGGAVESTTASIGSLANDNLASISGSGSLWRVNGTLTVGAVGATGNALVMGAGGMVEVSANVAVQAGCAVTNNVAAYSGGLDMTKSTATLTLNGTMAVNFVGDPKTKGLYWGLRWAGNHTNALQQLVSTGTLTIDDSNLAPFLRDTAGLHYDGTNSYVGLFVSRVPLPSERSTVILVR